MEYDSCSYPMFRQMRAAVRQQAELIAVSMFNGFVDLTYGSDQEMESLSNTFPDGCSTGLRPALKAVTENEDLKPGGHP